MLGLVVVSHVARWARNCSSSFNVPFCVFLNIPFILIFFIWFPLPFLVPCCTDPPSIFMFLYIWSLLPRWTAPRVSFGRATAFHGLHQIPLHNGLQVFFPFCCKKILLAHRYSSKDHELQTKWGRVSCTRCWPQTSTLPTTFNSRWAFDEQGP